MGDYYPTEVKKRIEILNKYEEVDKLYSFNILHLYPKELAFPNGYYDSNFFELIAFNTNTMQKINLGRHDAIDFFDILSGEGIEITQASVYADGSFLIKTKDMILVESNCQRIYMRKA